LPTPAFLYDDAYITLASTQALISGSDSYFPGTAPLYGVTSPVHCFVVLCLLQVLPPLWALLVSSGLGAGVYVAGLWRLSESVGLRLVERLAVVLAGLASGMVSQHQVNGLETSWAMAAVTWMLWSARNGRVATLGALAGTAPFVRPELVMVACVLLAWAAWRHPAGRLRLAATAAAAAAPWAAWLWWQTGGVVPTTLAAKSDWYAEGCWSLARRARVVGAGLAGWLLGMPALALGGWGLLRTSLGRLVLGAMAGVLVVWAASVPNVLHAYQRHRYYAVFLPLLIYGLLTVPRWLRTPALAVAGAMAVVSATAVARFEPAAIAQAMAVRREISAALDQQQARRVLLHDAGYLAFTRSGRDGVDMVGLKTPRAAALHAQRTGPSCGAARPAAIAALADETQPTHLVVWEPWDDFFGVTDALRQAGWSLTLTATATNREPIHLYAMERSQ
jgi:hypothetical protein